MKAFFENLEHTEHFPLQNKARRDAYRKKFTELAEACAKVLKVCFEAAEEILTPADPGSPPDDTAACKKSIQADFENYFKSSDKKLNRLLQ